MADTVILNGQDIGEAHRATRATSAVPGVVLAEHATTFDQVVLGVVLAAHATTFDQAVLGVVLPEHATTFDQAIPGVVLAEHGTTFDQAVLGVVLAEHGTTFDRWVVLSALATEAFPPERARLVPGLAGVLATGPAAVEAILDQAEVAGLAAIVSAPGGDPGAVRVELTAAGRAQHGTLRSAIDRVTEELYSGIPDADLAAAHRVLAEITWRADRRRMLWAATRQAEATR